MTITVTEKETQCTTDLTTFAQLQSKIQDSRELDSGTGDDAAVIADYQAYLQKLRAIVDNYIAQTSKSDGDMSVVQWEKKKNAISERLHRR